MNPAVWEFLDAKGRLLSVPIEGPLASDDAEVFVDAAVTGLGLLHAADWLVARHLTSGTLVRVQSEWRTPDEGAIHIVTPLIAGLPSKTRAFSDWLAAGFHPEPSWETAARSIPHRSRRRLFI